LTSSPFVTRPPSVKGAALLSRLSFVEEQRGRAGIERVLARLFAKDRARLEPQVLPFGWYDFDLTERLDLAIAAEFSAGNEIFLLLGARAAESEIAKKTGDKVLPSPLVILRRVSASYGAQYDRGRRALEKTGDLGAVIRTIDTDVASTSDCLVFVGWLRKAIALAGGRSASVEHPSCLARGEPLCEFVCSWSSG
jgi:hypothetical protein